MPLLPFECFFHWGIKCSCDRDHFHNMPSTRQDILRSSSSICPADIQSRNVLLARDPNGHPRAERAASWWQQAQPQGWQSSQKVWQLWATSKWMQWRTCYWKFSCLKCGYRGQELWLIIAVNIWKRGHSSVKSTNCNYELFIVRYPHPRRPVGLCTVLSMSHKEWILPVRLDCFFDRITKVVNEKCSRYRIIAFLAK